MTAVRVIGAGTLEQIIGWLRGAGALWLRGLSIPIPPSRSEANGRRSDAAHRGVQGRVHDIEPGALEEFDGHYLSARDIGEILEASSTLADQAGKDRVGRQELRTAIQTFLKRRAS